MYSSFFYDPWGVAADRHRHQRSQGRDMESPSYYPVNPCSTDARRRHYWPYRPEPEPYTESAYPPKRPTVSVPINFVSSKDEAKPARAPSAEEVRSAAAVAIQRALRGYLVRKNMKVVSQVAAELGAIERGVRSEVERLRADPRERLRVNEMMMTLLFRLDSVRGIRVYRKKVIRRVIVLQEFLDSISAGTLESTNSSGMEAPTMAEVRPVNPDSDTVHVRNISTEESTAQGCQDPAAGVAEEVVLREGEDAESQGRDSVSASARNEELAAPDHTDDLKTQEETTSTDDEFVFVSMEEATSTSPRAPSSEKSLAIEPMEQENRKTVAALPEEAPEVPMTARTMTDGATQEKASQANLTAGQSGIEEVLKKVMAESERLQVLVAALCEQNSQQCQLLIGLADRVGNLERAMQKIDKKGKRRRANSSLTPSSDRKGGGPTMQ